MNKLQVKVDKNDKSPLGKKRKQFNTLLQKIDEIKETIKNVEAQMQSGMVFYHAEIAPLYQKQQRVTADYVRRLHQLYNDKAFSKKDREKMAHIIVDSSGEILGAVGMGENNEYADIQAIFDEYNEKTWEETETEQRRDSNRVANDFFASMGFDLDLDPDDDLDTLEEKAKAAAERANNTAAEEAEAKARRPKNQKQAEKEAAREAEALNVKKISKTIYNDLVKLLHPDLEQDEALKAEKTEAMKKINEAWQNNDFFTLLTLQSVYFEKHGDSIAQLPDKQFNYYISVLKDQKSELEEQLHLFEMIPGIPGYVFNHLTGPNQFVMNLRRKQAVQQEKEDMKNRQHNLSLAQSPETLKHALKKYKIQEADDDFNLFDMLSMMSDMEDFVGGKRKKGRF